jgi:hypothetical protein
MDVEVTAGCSVRVGVAEAVTVAVGGMLVEATLVGELVEVGAYVITGVLVDSGASVGCPVWLSYG